ncbi:TadE/TadG family type IV pilus assembly protein [Sphingopyxis sp. KK2]|uniref:TadE/TadG family type IV pilus assembly protein n=1 Tax=Sphingopyxis sp. KK2 TaxID=1855727 RepID=UPI0021196BC9|nr:TadE/TadG family type IV pilus assembly protein [Sphingopyxis sp. KK2]
MKRPLTSLPQDMRGTAMIEMALLLPLFLMLLLGILIYGQYFLLAHSVQQAANDGARAAITGLDAADRRAVAIRAVDRSMGGIGGYRSELRSVLVSETREAVTVDLAYRVPEGNLLRSTLVPTPAEVIRARATFELPAD